MQRLFRLIALSMCSAVMAQSPPRAVLLVHRVTNTGTEPITAATACCILPTTNRYQEVIGRRIDPEPAETRPDLEGQDVITVPLGPLAPGETKAVRVLMWVRSRAVNMPLLGPPLRRPIATSGPTSEPAEGGGLPPAVRRGQLSDGSLLTLDRVRPIALAQAGNAKRDLDRARLMYEFLTRTVQYDIDEEFSTAEEILMGKSASCSELAYTYVALCRSLGLPTRIVSAYVDREPTQFATDWRTHRWAEVYTEDFGWVPVDPTNRITDGRRQFFGRQDGRYLTVIDDGVPMSDGGPDPSWLVLAAKVEPAGAPYMVERTAAWRTSGNRTDEARFFQEACAVIRAPEPLVRRSAVESWSRSRETLAMAFLLEALYDLDPQVRIAAAEAIGRMGNVITILPLMLILDQEKVPAVMQALFDAVRQVYDRSSGERRAEAVAELARSRKPEALAILHGAWTDRAREVRKAAVLALYKFGDRPEVHEAYRSLSYDSDEYIRTMAALRWSRLNSPESIPLLIDLLGSEVRWDRAQALAELQRRSGRTFDYDPAASPRSRRNVEAVQQFMEWAARQAQPMVSTAPG